MTPVEETSYDPKNLMIKGVINSSYDHKIKDHMNPWNKNLKQSDAMVAYLSQRFGSVETHTPFYRKVSWRLHDDTIRRLVGVVVDKNPSNPLAYFITCVRREKEYYTMSEEKRGNA